MKKRYLIIIFLILHSVSGFSQIGLEQIAYPRLISDSTVAITLQQVDQINTTRIKLIDAKNWNKIYIDEISNNQEIIKQQNALFNEKLVELKFKDQIIQKVSIDNDWFRENDKEMKKALLKQQRKTTFAWVVSGLITGVLGTLVIIK